MQAQHVRAGTDVDFGARDGEGARRESHARGELVRLGLRQMRAPAQDAHAEGEDGDAGDAGAEAAEAEDAEGFAGEAGVEAGLPGAGVDGAVVAGDVLGEGEDQGPGVLGGGVEAGGAGGGGPGDDDAAVGGGGDVEAGVARPGREEEFEVREARQDGRGEGGAFAHGGDDLEGVQAGDEGFVVGAREGVGEFGYLEAFGGYGAEFGEGDGGVVVEDGEGEGGEAGGRGVGHGGGGGWWRGGMGWGRRFRCAEEGGRGAV